MIENNFFYLNSRVFSEVGGGGGGEMGEKKRCMYSDRLESAPVTLCAINAATSCHPADQWFDLIFTLPFPPEF